MATELGKAYVQIIPSAQGISGSISQALGGEAASAGKSAGLNIVGAIKGAIAAAGIGKAIKASLDAGGALQQSFGGLDTIYGEAGEAAKKYAAEAAKAGISANSYAEQAVSFGASLKQAYGGDTVKAVEAANTAILDMADNSAKMGTDIGSIQNAYQGFAKQNYTMLDNLKLGYGGTKTEMQRLLADATKLSGVEYDISNLGDVYDAIHVIQEDLGLTGVAAAEAEGTFTGSMGAMKASAENLLANLALGNSIEADLQALMGNAEAFIMKNLVPMVSNILNALPELLSGVGNMLIQALNLVSNNAGEIVQQGIDIVVSLVKAIVQAAPYLVEAAVKLVAELGKALLTTDWVAVGTDLINSLKESMALASGEIFGSDTSIIDSVLNSITNGLPSFLDKGVEMISNLVNGILSSLPSLITMAGQLITTFATFLMQNYPVIMQKGVELLLNLVNGIITNLPQIIATALEVISSFAATILANLPTILTQGILMIGQLAAGLLLAIPKLLAALPQIFSAIKSAFDKFDFKQIGFNILLGIRDGILGAIDKVVEAAKEAGKAIWETMKGFFKIESPSRLMMYAGEMIDAGMAKGITDNEGMVNSAISSLSKNAYASVDVTQSAFSGASGDNRVGELIDLLNNYLPTIANGDKIVLEGDAGRLFRLMQRESVKNTQLVGTNAVLSST